MGLFKKKKAPKPKVPLHHITFHVVLGLNQLDCIRQIIFDSKLAWGAGYKVTHNRRRGGFWKRITSTITEETPDDFQVTENTEVRVNAGNLFGGRSKEGGVSGNVDIMFGRLNQTINSHLKKVIGKGKLTPAYRGVTSLLFKDFYVGTSPYMKPLSVVATRIMRTYAHGIQQWYPEKAQIGLDMNPAHIIREVLVSADSEYGMNIPENLIDDQSFTVCADRLYTEKLGLSFLWDNDTSTSDFITMVNKHINALLIKDRYNGKYKLKLIRNDYNHSDVRVLNDDEIVEITKYATPEMTDLYNQVTVKFWDRAKRKNGSVTVNNPALYAMTGSVNATTISYQGVCTEELAKRLATRELQTMGTPLASVTLKCNRLAFDLELGDVVKIYSPLDHIPTEFVFRIVKTSIDPSGNYIELRLMQDIFGNPNAIISSSPQVDLSLTGNPTNAKNVFLYELSRSDIRWLFQDVELKENETNFAVIAESTARENNYTVALKYGNEYLDIGKGTFDLIVGTTKEITYTNTEIFLTNVTHLEPEDIIMIGNERMQVVDVVLTDDKVIVKRGLEDTHPAIHGQESLVYRIDDSFVRPQSFTTGDYEIKLLTLNANDDELPLTDATTHTIALKARHNKPYPVQNIKIDGSYFPHNIGYVVEGVRKYINVSACGRGDVSTHWFDSTHSNIQGVKAYAQVKGASNKTEIKLDGTDSQVTLTNTTNLNDVVIEVWTERTNGDKCYYPFTHTVSILGQKLSLWKYVNTNRYDFNNQYKTSYNDNDMPNGNYFMLDWQLRYLEQPYLYKDFEIDPSKVKHILAQYKIGTYNTRRGLCRVSVECLNSAGEIIQKVQSEWQGDYDNNKWRDFSLETSVTNDTVKVRFKIEVYKNKPLDVNSLAFKDVNMFKYEE